MFCKLFLLFVAFLPEVFDEFEVGAFTGFAILSKLFEDEV